MSYSKFFILSEEQNSTFLTNQDEFIIKLKKGSEAAFAELLDEYQQKVFHTCISFVPNKEDAEDIAQEVFLEVYRSVHKFKGNSKLSTWIYKICTNKCLEFIRKKNAKKRFAFMQPILGNEIPLDKTSFFNGFNRSGERRVGEGGFCM